MSVKESWAYWMGRFPSVFILNGRKWTAETHPQWIREHSDEQFRNALSEFVPTYAPTESGILFRDRRRSADTLEGTNK